MLRRTGWHCPASVDHRMKNRRSVGRCNLHTCTHGDARMSVCGTLRLGTSSTAATSTAATTPAAITACATAAATASMAATRATGGGHGSVTAASRRTATSAAPVRVRRSGRGMPDEDTENRGGDEQGDEQGKVGHLECNCLTDKRSACDQELLAKRIELGRPAHRPDIRRRGLTEGRLVAFDRLLVLALELVALDDTAGARFVVELQPQILSHSSCQ